MYFWFFLILWADLTSIFQVRDSAYFLDLQETKIRFFIAFLLACHTVGDSFFYIYLYTSRMKVLVVNSGSSSLKYQVFNMEDQSILGKGLVERI